MYRVHNGLRISSYDESRKVENFLLKIKQNKNLKKPKSVNAPNEEEEKPYPSASKQQQTSMMEKNVLC